MPVHGKNSAGIFDGPTVPAQDQPVAACELGVRGLSPGNDHHPIPAKSRSDEQDQADRVGRAGLEPAAKGL